MKPETNDRDKIAGAFRELRKSGWFARMNFWCCQSCGCAAVPKSCKDKFVFYHKQDAESFGIDGNIGGELGGERYSDWRGRNKKDSMYMSHGEGGDANEIVAILNKHGLYATWDGSNGTRIMVKHKE